MGKSYGSDALKRKYQTEKYYKVGKLKIQLKHDETHWSEKVRKETCLKFKHGHDIIKIDF